MGIIESLRLPEDVLRSSSIINILGNNSMVIENFKAIMEYKEDYIKIRAKNKIIIINGEKLFIEGYDKEEIKISGRMDSIFFEGLKE